MASALRTSTAALLAPPSLQLPPAAASTAPAAAAGGDARVVLVNGLLSPPVSGDVEADAAAAAAAAAALVAAGYTAIKVKVARRADPAHDAAVLAAVRRGVGPHVVLRADANRGWGNLEQAVAFGRAAAGAGVGLQYLEEPCADPRDMAAFYQQTGVPVAADESLDEGLLLPRPACSHAGLPADRAAGLAAVVVKPAVVGGLEAAAEVAQWAQRRGVQVVISSAFESSVGLSGLLQLAAAVDSWQQQQPAAAANSPAGPTHHGLGTLQWFSADVAEPPLRFEPQLLRPTSASSGAAVAASSHGSASAGAVGPVAADGGGYLPLQALCGGVEQSNRLLQGAQLNGPQRTDAVAANPDPWVGAGAHGGITQRDLSVEAFLRPDLLSPNHPATPSSSHHRADDGGQCPLRVAVRGIELLPPTAAASARSHGAALPAPPPFLFLHGFLGSSTDWLPLMRALAAAGHRCVALDLPGHGATRPAADAADAASSAASPPSSSNGPHREGPQLSAVAGQLNGRDEEEVDAEVAEAAVRLRLRLPTTPAHTIPGAAACVAQAAEALGLRGAVLVGYSLGARVALQAVAAGDGASSGDRSNGNGGSSGHSDGGPSRLWRGAVLVSGTPGIKDPAQAVARAANDDRLAQSLVRSGLTDFVRHWYDTPLWSSLRRHPAFDRMLARRTAAAGAAAGRDGGAAGSADEAAAQAAAALSGMSTGRMAPLWDRLDPWVGPPVVLVAGELDAKFVDINTYTLARLVRRHTAEAAARLDASAAPDGANAAAGVPAAAAQAQTASGPAPAPVPGPARSGMPVSEQLAALGAALVLVEGCGHAVHVEGPERLLGVLREAAAAMAAAEQRGS
ncbi:hypothetical protein GPECTOR_9g536 [Gonium pectorale]|uniref:Mandelate racemase/muconate lactonizing enzyme C-terminal domain-containing protein n=1 Tax=Gonium pectorale TaxID=33097 RepID=A0A150GRV8_GONPE|nr:hypothetical protein GPECTOR_9g536 [Gonium pectorale]|eukprot:KXZ52492.1 hypothetical protein GPECTOR_9g536 [Gonium pectorale]